MPARSERGRTAKPRRPRGSVYFHDAKQLWCAQTPPPRRVAYFRTLDAAEGWRADAAEVRAMFL